MIYSEGQRIKGVCKVWSSKTAASALPGDLLETQISETHSRPNKSAVLRPAIYGSTGPPGDSDEGSNLGTLVLSILPYFIIKA